MQTLETVTFLEELQMNQWPSLQTMLLDGWILRFADGYSKRANSIHPLYHSTYDLDKKIAACEQIYERQQIAPVFKISPSVYPGNLDAVLERKGYSLVDRCSIQTMKLDDLKEPVLQSVCIHGAVTDEWLDHYCRLAQAADHQKAVMRQMFGNIRTQAAFVSLDYEEQVVACGIGIIERDYIGLWDIITDPNYRNRGLGEQLLLHMLKWGKENGATNSYLVVVANNAPAQKLYAKLGFQEQYQHWYRVKEKTKKTY